MSLLRAMVVQGEFYELPYRLALITSDGKSPFVTTRKEDDESIMIQLWRPNDVVCGQNIDFTGMTYVSVNDIKDLVPKEFELVFERYEDEDMDTEVPVRYIKKA